MRLLQSYRLYQTSMFDLSFFQFLTYKNQHLILCMQYDSFTRIWVCIVFLFFNLLRQVFLSKDNGFFSLLPLSTIDFSIKIVGFFITQECDLSYGSLSLLAIHSQASVFSPFGGVAGWKRSTRKPPWTRMQYGPPFIIDRLSPGGVLREGAFHKFFDIYTPHPKTAPDQGMLNRYFPLRETPQRLGTRMLYHVWFCSCNPCDLTLLFSSLSPTIQLEKTFFKW